MKKETINKPLKPVKTIQEKPPSKKKKDKPQEKQENIIIDTEIKKVNKKVNKKVKN